MEKYFLIFLFSVFFLGTTEAQTAHKLLRSADKEYKTSNFNTAEEAYRKSLEKENSAQGRYNLGNAIYQQERFDEAIKQYNDVLESTDDKTIRKDTYHNLGNAHFSKEEYDKSIEAYKNALRLDSKDMETKKNLAQALRLMQQQQKQQQQQQQDNQEENEDQEKQEQEEQQQSQDQTKEEQDQQQQQQQQQESEAEETPQEKDLNKEEARKLLQIMEDEEKEVQKKMKKGDGTRGKQAKDW